MRSVREAWFLAATAALLGVAAACGGPDGQPPDRPQSRLTGGASSLAAPSPDQGQKLIETAFFDLGQYAAVSKFRSCEGHDFSGLNVQGESESGRSMKHYLQARSDLVGSTGKLAVRAPFDGRIEMLEPDQRGHRLGIVSAAHPNWMLLFFHTDPASGLELGSTVKVGQTVGYGNLAGGSENFDVTLKWSPGGNSQQERWDSPILHLTDSVAADFARHGLTPDTLVVGKSVRDASPCHEFRHSADNWTAVRQ
jgi:hypothetical protein